MENLSKETIKNLEEENLSDNVINKTSFLRRESTFEAANESKEDKLK